MPFGTTLSDAQSALDRERGLQASQLYNALSQVGQMRLADANRAAQMEQAEADRAYRYFGLGQQRQLSLKQLEHEASRLDKEIAGKKDLAKMQIDAQAQDLKDELASNLKIAELQSATQKDVAGKAYAPERMDSRLWGSLLTENIRREETNRDAATLAAQANDKLAAALKRRGDKLKIANTKAVERTPREPLKRLFSGPHRAIEAERQKSLKAAQSEYEAEIIGIIDSLGKDRTLITYDPAENMFKPVQSKLLNPAASMIPSSLGNLEVAEQGETEPPRMAASGAIGLTERKALRANQLARENPTATRQEIIRQVNREFGQ